MKRVPILNHTDKHSDAFFTTHFCQRWFSFIIIAGIFYVEKSGIDFLCCVCSDIYLSLPVYYSLGFASWKK